MTGRNPRVLCLALAAVLAALQVKAQQQTPPPEFHPADGASVPVSVIISGVSPETQVYYTTDGTVATSNSFHYTVPITLTNTITLRARAYLAGFTPSDERTATYYERNELVTVRKLVADNGTPKASVSVNLTPAAAVRSYAIQETIPSPLEASNISVGGSWDEESRTIRWGPFEDAQPRSLTYQVSSWQDGVWEIPGRVSLNGFSTKNDDSTTKATVTIQHTYAQAANPVFSSPGGTTVPVTVTLTCETPNASINFTTDGTVPDRNSAQYAAPLPFTDTTFLRARAFAEGMDPSDVTSAAYWESDLPVAPTRAITSISGAVASVNISVPVTGVQCDALIESLPNGLGPSAISNDGVWNAETGTILWGPFRNTLPTNLTYEVTGPDGTYTLDGVASFDGRSVAIAGDTQVVITRPTQQVTTPQIDSPGGVALPANVTITCATPSATIYYTTNGALPTTADPPYTAPLTITGDTILRVRAFKDGWLPSEPASAYYVAATETPMLTRTVINDASALPEVHLAVTPVSGTKSYAVQEVVPRTLTPSAISHDGSWDQTAGTIRWGPFEDNTPRTLTYSLQGPDGTYALDGQASFDGRSFSFTGVMQVVVTNGPVQQVQTPVLSPSGSTTVPVTVTITCGTDGAAFRYTIDGTVPDTSATLYTGPLELTVPTVLRVRAFKPGMSASDTVSGNYGQGEHSRGSIVRTMANNGSRTPTCSLAVIPANTVKSHAVEERLPPLLLPSSISHGGAWDETTATIQWGPFEDNAPRSLSYTVSAPDGDYALDGSGSFDGWSTQTTGDLTVSIAGHLEQVATPEFSPPNGGQVPVTVSISCATPGVAVYYTTSGLVPTTNDTRYTGLVSLTGETTLRARAFKTDFLPSDTASATYYAALNPGTIVRAIRSSPSTIQDVSLTLTPAASVRVYTVEEYVPTALQPSAINADGKWSAEERLIRWGPFPDYQARTFSYSVSGPDGDYSFDGAASFDGINRDATGDTTTVIRFPAPTSLIAVAGNGAVYLRWDRMPGAVGYNVYFRTAGNVNSPQVLNVGNPGMDYFPVNGLTNNTEYYFSVTAYDLTQHESGRSENVKAVPSANVGVLGFVWFDRTAYSPTDQAVVSVLDPDFNTDASTAQTVTVKIMSDSDPWGFMMTLKETGINSNLFTSRVAGTNLTFSSGTSDPASKRVQIAEGNRITVVYQDVLPAMERRSVATVQSAPPVTLTVWPDTTTSYGSVLVGTKREQTFTVSNVSTSTISGSVSVAVPFSVVSGGNYTLTSGQSQAVTVRYTPMAAGNDTAFVTFTGSGGAMRQVTVTGFAYTDLAPTTGAIAGQVTRVTGSSPVNGVTISVIGPNGTQCAQTVTKVSGGKAGVFSVFGLRPGEHYRVTANPPARLPLGTATTDIVTVEAGQTKTVNIALPSIDQPPTPTPENIPVVLVRGIHLIPEPKGESGYWEDMREALTKHGFQVWDSNEGDLVIDGADYIEPNAARLKAYIQMKVSQDAQENEGKYPPKINIVAHSMGGLIVRQALGNNDQFVFNLVDLNGRPRCVPVKVGKVIMLATPNAGTRLADLNPLRLAPWFHTFLGTNAVRNLTSLFVRYEFNPLFSKWPSSVALYLFSATGGVRSPVLCIPSGIITDSGLPLGLDEILNDGAVTVASTKGEYWAYGLHWPPLQRFTSVALNPVESVTDEQVAGMALDHIGLVKDQHVIDWVIDVLAGSTTRATLPVTVRAADVAISKSTTTRTLGRQSLSMQQFEQATDTIASGESKALAVVSDASTTVKFVFSSSDADLGLKVQDPFGAVIDSTTPLSNDDVQYSTTIDGYNSVMITFTINKPAPGTWHAVLDGSSMTSAQANCSLMVFGDSSVALLPQTGPLFNQGQDVVVSCALADLENNPATPVANASISATLSLPDGSTSSLTLVDDGWHNDGAPNDGVYAGVLGNVQQAGSYSVTYRATGTNGQGQALQRVATGGFSVSSGNGSLMGDPVYEHLDTDGDGIEDFLEVKCWVNPTAGGNYILAGDLVDASGAHRFSQSTAFAADGSGPNMATLMFDLAEMRAAGGQGSYHIENLQLFETATTGTAWLDAYRGSSDVNIQAARTTNVSPKNLAKEMARTATLLWSDGGGSGSYDVYFGTDAANLPLKINQTGTTYDPGTLAYDTTYYWRVDARNAAGVTTGDTWSFTTLFADYSDGCFYRTNNGTVTITGYNGPDGAVTIPNTIDGKPVTCIGANAFQARTSLTSITIPSSVTSIGDHAFSSCTNLTGVYFQGNVPTPGSDLFLGDDGTTIYYLTGTTGWEALFAGRPTARWAPWLFTINLTNADKETVEFGMQDGATSGYEDTFDHSSQVAPAPGMSAGGIYFSDATGVLYQRDVHPPAVTDTWNLRIQANQQLMTLSWTANTIPAGRQFILREVNATGATIPGTVLNLATTTKLSVHAQTSKHYALAAALAVAPQTVTLSLVQGWNLISLPVEPANPAVDAVLGTATRDGGRDKVFAGTVWQYVCNGTGEGHYETVTEMHALLGYWVYSPTSATPSVIGTPLAASQKLGLPKDWSLIGPTADVGVSQNNNLRAPVWWWDAVTCQYKTLDPASEVLTAGRGYWFYVKQAADLEFGR